MPGQYFIQVHRMGPASYAVGAKYLKSFIFNFVVHFTRQYSAEWLDDSEECAGTDVDESSRA
jgi:hypothetical protein